MNKKAPLQLQSPQLRFRFRFLILQSRGRFTPKLPSKNTSRWGEKMEKGKQKKQKRRNPSTAYLVASERRGRTCKNMVHGHLTLIAATSTETRENNPPTRPLTEKSNLIRTSLTRAADASLWRRQPPDSPMAWELYGRVGMEEM